jgi:hypothetical protein
MEREGHLNGLRLSHRRGERSRLPAVLGGDCCYANRKNPLSAFPSHRVALMIHVEGFERQAYHTKYAKLSGSQHST